MNQETWSTKLAPLRHSVPPFLKKYFGRQAVMAPDSKLSPLISIPSPPEHLSKYKELLRKEEWKGENLQFHLDIIDDLSG